ncbi:ABC transporter ATP-binding protein [Patescibacteria group bacterium]
MTGKTILKIKKIKKSFKKKKVLQGINLSVNKGEAFGLVGPNGTGKSVLVKTILGLIIPDNGEVRIFNKCLKSNLKDILSRVNFAASYSSLYDEITAFENLLTFAKLYNVKNEKLKINELIKFFRIQELVKEKRKVKYFSSGEKLKLILAKALINDPEILFLDEPFVNLDHISNLEFLNLLKKTNKEKKMTIFFISHNYSEIMSLCNRVGFMYNGRLVKIGNPKYIKKEYLKYLKKH